MTYEEKLLEVFARFQGDGVSEATLERIERACNAEVWRHLPLDVRSSWRLHLAFSQSRPGQIELVPQQLREDGAPPARLEAALGSPFREEEPVGGVAGISIGFGSPSVAEVPRPSAARSPETAAEPPAPEARNRPASAPPTVGSPLLDVRSIAAQAAALGIALPPNESLLGPFLEALHAATEYRARAEAAEAALEKLRRALD